MKKALLLFGALIILSSFVYADCVVPYDGMVITQNTTFCAGTYYFYNGPYVMENNLVLDCNNSDLRMNQPQGGATGYGLTLYQKNNVIIKNCIFRDFSNGIFIQHGINNVFFNNIFIGNLEGIFISSGYASNNYFFNNTFLSNSIGLRIVPSGSFSQIVYDNQFFNNTEGIQLVCSSKNLIKNNNISLNKYGIKFSGWAGCTYNITLNNITKNIFYKNNLYGVEVGDYDLGDGSGIIVGDYSQDNNIWDNEFYTTGIHVGRNLNNFCINGIGNHYFNGATGPTCPIIDSDNDGVPDSEDKCPNTLGQQIVYGCSCEQILALKPGEDTGNNCSSGVIDVFTKEIGWAREL